MAIDSAFAAPWVFIIDTNQYAGNFERAMCAYCTGMIGQCEVGEEMTILFEDDLGLEADKYHEDNPPIKTRKDISTSHRRRVA